MKILKSNLESEIHAIISYSHADTDAIKKEFEAFDQEGVCYWFDEEMEYGGSYVAQFRSVLDLETCKGCIFFISPRFLLSKPCAEEMEYFLQKYGVNNPKKFCLLVASPQFPLKGPEEIYEYVRPMADLENASHFKGLSLMQKDRMLGKHIDLFWELAQHGKALIGQLGGDYLKRSCKDGQLFSTAGIMLGRKEVAEITFGYFPQNSSRSIRNDCHAIEENSERRTLDGEHCYFAPVEWLVIADNAHTSILLSKKLLFPVDYLGLKYPLQPTDKTIGKIIKDKFDEYFKQDKNDKRKIKKVGFLPEEELKLLLRRAKNDAERMEILMPKVTHFAQLSNNKDARAFWLAGDIEDARRVNVSMGRLSENPVGVEMYYVRVVIEVEK